MKSYATIKTVQVVLLTRPYKVVMPPLTKDVHRLSPFVFLQQSHEVNIPKADLRVKMTPLWKTTTPIFTSITSDITPQLPGLKWTEALK